MSEEKTPGQAAYEARQVAKGRRMGAREDETDAQILAVIGLGWDELPAGIQADEEAGARAAIDASDLADDFTFERNQVIELRAVVLDMARSIRADMNGGGRIARSEVIDWTARAGVEFDIYAEPGSDQ
jgi:hypothetical protein